MNEMQSLRIGPALPSSEWDKGPEGDCQQCGGQCDGDDCGLHAAGCVFGGFGYAYWLIAEDCPLWHGE